MALGGGNFTSYNKVLPGSYYNVISANMVSADTGNRGVVAMPYIADYGKENEVIKITSEDFAKSSLEILGYEAESAELAAFREVFLGSKVIYAYKLNSGGTKAENDYATALYSGARGNALCVDISASVDSDGKYEVRTILGTKIVDKQIVASEGEIRDNAYLIFKKDKTLETGLFKLSGGTTKLEVTASDYQVFLDKIEGYTFNALICPSIDDAVKELFVQFTKRMRDEVGVKFQTVIYRKSDADYEGIVSVTNKVEVDASGNAVSVSQDISGASVSASTMLGENALVYHAGGIVGGCSINSSNTNKIYNGIFDVKADYTQRELEEGLSDGKFIYHNVNDDVRVLMDINTYTSFTTDKNSDFASNQTVRILDQDATETGLVFANKYLGAVPNDDIGRSLFKSDMLAISADMVSMRAIEEFSEEDIVIKKGEDKTSVIITKNLKPVGAMEKLYTTVTVY